nr:FecR domain-containing protein [Janthinobacterium sp. Marseille]
MNTDTHSGMTEQDQIQREAQAWLRRLASGEATQLDIQGFRRWREKSPLHWTTFTEAKRLWQMLDPALAQVAQREAVCAANGTRLVGNKHGRRAFLGFATGAAAAAGAAIVYPPLGLWPAINEWQADYRTTTGEQRMLALANDVKLELNTQTSVNRQSAQGEVPAGIKLVSGETAIDLSASAPAFSVNAGAGRSIAQASRFEVRNLDNKVCVTCIEGEVLVEHPLGKRRVYARQQVVYDADTLSPPATVALADWSAWRKGTLVFWQTPLDKVVAEINRYRPGKVVLLASHLNNRAVSGRFAIASLDTVLLQIQQSYDLKAHTLPNGILVLS